MSVKPDFSPENWPTYEILLPRGIDIKKFEADAACGVGRFWLTRMPDTEMARFQGVIFPKDRSKGWVRILLDLEPDYCYVTTPGVQALSALDVARETRDALGGSTIYHNGTEVPD